MTHQAKGFRDNDTKKPQCSTETTQEQTPQRDDLKTLTYVV